MNETKYQRMQRVKMWVTRASVGTGTLAVAGLARAQSVDVSGLFDSIDFSSIATKVLAIGVVVIGIFLVIAGIGLAKRVIGKLS
jgi:hypothetical protein